MNDKLNSVTTTERSLEIIEIIQNERGATVSDIAEQTDLARSTVHKHVNTLRKHGYLERNGERYDLGLKFYNKGNYVAETRPYFNIAGRIVDELSERLGEDIEFIVENGGQGMVVAAAYHKRSKYNTDQHLGSYYPLHATAAGKAILSGLSNQQVSQIFSQQTLEAYTDTTIVSEDELLEELDEIRERGYARSDEEFEEGLRAVAKRVDAPTGSPLGAISVLAPIYRMPDEDFKQQIPQIVADKVIEFESDLCEEMSHR